MRSFSESAKALERTFFISMSEMSSMKSVFQSSGALSNLIMGYTSASPWSSGFLISRPSRIWAAVLPLTTTSFFPSLCTDSNLVDTPANFISITRCSIYSSISLMLFLLISVPAGGTGSPE